MWQKGSGILMMVAAVTLAGTSARAQGRGRMGMGAGMNGMAQDSTTRAEMRVIHELVVNNERIRRTVTNLPNGIRTETTSDDPRLAQLIREHVLTMDQRVRRSDDPGLPMESPALHAIYRSGDKVQTVTDTTATGIVVVQTSTDSSVVAALQQHAREVTDLVQRGMAAMHEAMMNNMGGGRMMPGMHGDSAAPPHRKHPH